MPTLDLAVLGDPRPLPVTSSQIAAVSGRFGAFWKTLWQDVEQLSACFWATVSEDPVGDDAKRAWHHLLLAVGNFKRSARPILPTPGIALEAPKFRRLDQFEIPGLVAIGRLDPLSWRNLTADQRLDKSRIPGLGVATASTLLAALWPDDHAIFDRRAGYALFALVCELTGELDGTGTVPDLNDWGVYERYRAFVLETVAATGGSSRAFEVERTLHFVDANVRPVLKSMLQAQGRPKDTWLWSEYRSEAMAFLNKSWLLRRAGADS